MNSRHLVDQLLRAGQSLLDEQRTRGPSHGHGAAGGRSDRGGLNRGALATGALGLLLGSKRTRKAGGKMGKYGGLAALSTLVYRAHKEWQSRSGNQVPREPQTVDRVSDAEAEIHSHAILRALIGAAKSDGHIDDRERELIEAEVSKLDEDQEIRTWLDAELRKSLDPAEVAAAATSEEIAAEMYLASVLMVDEQNYMERAYLDELSRQLRLEPGLRQKLERQVAEA